ncbi:hypothetical protein ZONE111905_21240 [Zobellia nedashkovskayae]
MILKYFGFDELRKSSFRLWLTSSIRKVGLQIIDFLWDKSQAKTFAFCFYLIFIKAKSKDLAT